MIKIKKALDILRAFLYNKGVRLNNSLTERINTMEKINVSLSLQIKLAHQKNKSFITVNNDTVRIFRSCDKCIAYLDLYDLDEGITNSDANVCEVVTDLDQAGKWFSTVGTGNLNDTNIKKAFAILRKNARVNNQQ